MPWFFDSYSGKLVHEDWPSPGYLIYAGLVHSGTGWHELTIPDSDTLAQATAAAAKAFPNSPPANTQNNPFDAPSQAVGSSGLAPLADVGQFFHALTEKETWTRVAEVILGGILVYAGVKALSSGTAVGAAGSAAAKPVKKVSKAGASVAVPEARLGARIAAKRVAPKTTARVASHRRQVAQYGARKPYSPPAPRPATKRVTHIYHHKVKP